MKYFLILLTLIIATSVSAQTAEDSVKAVINKMFAAMKNADGASLKECFADSAIMQTIGRNKEGKTVIRNDGTAGFIDFVSKEKQGAADERISFETVKIDGPLAIAWTPYSFYYNGKFSHCGVNSFQLVRINGTWKIQYLIDTRRKAGCTPE
jgi:hypothetical protein